MYCISFTTWKLDLISNKKELFISVSTNPYNILHYKLGVSKTHLLPLEVIQRKILKVLLIIPNRSCSDMLYDESRMFDIRQLFYSSLVLCQYKEKQNMFGSNKSIVQKSYKYLDPTVFYSLIENIQLHRSYSRLRCLMSWYVAHHTWNFMKYLIGVIKYQFTIK